MLSVLLAPNFPVVRSRCFAPGKTSRVLTEFPVHRYFHRIVEFFYASSIVFPHLSVEGFFLRIKQFAFCFKEPAEDILAEIFSSRSTFFFEFLLILAFFANLSALIKTGSSLLCQFSWTKSSQMFWLNCFQQFMSNVLRLEIFLSVVNSLFEISFSLSKVYNFSVNWFFAIFLQRSFHFPTKLFHFASEIQFNLCVVFFVTLQSFFLLKFVLKVS